MRRQNFQLFVSRRICQSPANATHLLRNLAPALLAHMLLLVSKWKCFVLMFLLSSLGSMQSLSLPPFFPAVFRASVEAASSLILQIMPSAVTFYSSSSGLFSPQKISQHCGCVTMHCVLPPSHQWAQAPEQCLPSSVPVATSSVAPGVTTVRTRVFLAMVSILCFHGAGCCSLPGMHSFSLNCSGRYLLGLPLYQNDCC